MADDDFEFEPDGTAPEEILEEAIVEMAMREGLEKLKYMPPAECPANPPTPDEDTRKIKDEDYCQWAIGGNGKFSPVGSTTLRLPAGIYEAFANPGTWGVERLNIHSDEIYELPDMATNLVIDEVETFWANEHRYREHNLLYKRGIILHGPPGGGKTVTVKLLMNKLIEKDGIVLVVNNIHLSTMVLKAIRRIEPHRNLINIFEDIDEIMHANGEAALLSMLDGENNIDRVLNIATTNYPERLGARIINRPSRFDRRVKVGMPSKDARLVYLEKTTKGNLASSEIKKWVLDTEGMSVAHLRELVAAVYCLGQSYDDVIKRLQDMAKQVRSDAEFKRGDMGFATARKVSKELW